MYAADEYAADEYVPLEVEAAGMVAAVQAPEPEPEPEPEPVPEPEMLAQLLEPAPEPTPPLDLPFIALERVVVAGEEIDEVELVWLSPEALRVLRNTVFARHGQTFADGPLGEHFNDPTTCPWYTADPEYDHSALTGTDERNIARILAAEDQSATQAQVRVAKQMEDVTRGADDLRVLDAYLTDKMAVEDGEAPEGFELQPLQDYKKQHIEVPLTLKRKSAARE
jgi:hypothetical protein